MKLNRPAAVGTPGGFFVCADIDAPPEAILLARNQNTFEKLRREQEKKRKAKEKRERREKKKDAEGDSEALPPPIVDRFDLAGDH